MTKLLSDEELQDAVSDATSHEDWQHRHDAVIELIKQYALSKQIEARIDELTLLATYQFTDGVDVMGRSERSWSDRIAELRKQQELR